MNQIITVLLLLVRLAFNLVPPYLWLGAMFIVVLWLVVMVKIWRLDDWQRRARVKRRAPQERHC